MNTDNLYKLPWTFRNNISSWIDINDFDKNPKKITELNKELRVIESHRQCESIILSGPKVLSHPELKEILTLINRFNKKVFIAEYENEILLNLDKLKDLSHLIVGLITYLTKDLDQDKQTMAKIGKAAYKSKLSIYFNKITTSNTIKDIPELVKYAESNAKIINNLIFVGAGSPCLSLDKIVSKIDSSPCAMLGGTSSIEDVKWVFVNKFILGSKKIGEMNDSQMKVVQMLSQIRFNSWAGFFKPTELIFSKIFIILFLLQMRTVPFFFSVLWQIIKNPINLLRPIRIQSIIAVQPTTCKDNIYNFCDGCPNVTVYKGKLMSRCKVDILRNTTSYLNKSVE